MITGDKSYPHEVKYSCNAPRDYMKTVVTGGAGFIGIHLVKKLVDEGRDVVIVDDFSRGKEENISDLGVKNVELRKADLRDPRESAKALKGAGIVYHLAARVGGIEYMHGSENAELKALQDNLTIDTNVFKFAMDNGIKKIIYASSVSVYPMDLQHKHGVILSEEDMRYTNPEGGYGWAKLMGEIQLGWIKNIDVGIARIFNVYGECEPLDKTTYMVPALIKKAVLFPKEDFVVWGDGNQSRCLLYASDCVDALMKLEQRATNPPLAINIGSDVPVSIRTVAEKIVKISGKDMKIKYDTSKPTGALSRTANVRKVKALLGWEPKIDLDEGLKRTYTWAEKKLARKRI